MSAPHIAAIALYRAGFGYKRICDRLRIPRSSTKAILRVMQGCGGGDVRRCEAGKGDVLAAGVANRTDIIPKSDYWAHATLEQQHNAWWRAAFPQAKPKKHNHAAVVRDPQRKAKLDLRKMLWRFLKGKDGSRRTRDIVGCTPDFFRAHLASYFTSGIRWENYGIRGWHMDHVIPCDGFDLLDLEQVKRCFHYTNIRPLWGVDNIRKGNRILPEFAHLVAA